MIDPAVSALLAQAASGPHRPRMGLVAIPERDWIVLGDDQREKLVLKRRLLAERHGEVFAALPGTGIGAASGAADPSQGATRASTSSRGTRRRLAMPGVSRSRASAASACRARAAGSASTICTVMPPASVLRAAEAALRSDRPAPAAITVSATMMAITQGIGPESRACGIRGGSTPARPVRRASIVMPRCPQPAPGGGGDSAEPR